MLVSLNFYILIYLFLLLINLCINLIRLIRYSKYYIIFQTGVKFSFWGWHILFVYLVLLLIIRTQF